MNIEIQVVGGTHKTVRAKLTVNSVQAGELSMMRDDFTKFAELIFQGKYTIGTHPITNQINEHLPTEDHKDTAKGAEDRPA